ncbi:NAD(P)-dependent oxidoreductase [Undibacterium sp. TJN25]|uniref:NAD(P)-dependent oxidoreductase n=1 Tax=Undibacterium sp. TJN25 TaxID=3413056 RepID=UPI003BF39A3A
MAKISILGLGAMGARMAINLIKAGHDITVWNRSTEAMTPLINAGAKPATTPKEAARNADFVLAVLRDDEASRQVWLDPENGALVGMPAHSIAIESSTLSVEWIRELGASAAARGLSLLEAPVIGSTPQAQAAQLIYFVGGDAGILQRSQEVLTALGTSIHHIGPLGSGAFAKLATNTLLGIQVTVVAELIGMLKHSEADVDRVLAALATTPAWSAAAGRVSGLMLSRNFEPQFPIKLMEKDLGYTLQIAKSEAAAPTITAAREVFRAAIEQGYGGDNMTGVVKLFT